MKSRCSSAPRMERVFTPRVKDGRLSNDSPQVHYYNKTATKFTNKANPNYHHNPESSPLKQKVHYQAPEQQVQQIIDQKLSVVQPPEPKDQNNRGGQAKKGAKNQQKTIYGRNLQFPAAERPVGFNNFNERRPQTAQIKRSNSMYSSVHYVDRSTKSSVIKEKKKQFDQKFKAAFGYLLDNNQAYLKECRRACNQKARPKDEIFKIKRPNITTTNKDEYGQKDTPYAQHMDPRAETVANSFGPTKVCGNSTSNEFHCGKTGPRADLAQWPDHYKLQGPLYSVTQYGNSFPHPGNYQKMVPIATFNEHPLGMPHRTNSTSRTFHKGQFTKRADLATWNNLHPYGNDFNPERGTTYGTRHNFKDQQPIQQWPMYDPQLIKSDGKFTTEYGTKLVDPTAHELNEANYCRCGRKPCQH